eukprot:922011-Amorphochlora_amoeboformis.AAC.1
MYMFKRGRLTCSHGMNTAQTVSIIVPGMYQKILDLERNTKKQASKEEASNGTGEGGQSANEGKTEGMYSNDHIRKVMAMLSDECRFLVDSNTLESCKG